MLMIEKTGTGSIEKTGTGEITRITRGVIEKTGTGRIEKTGTGRIAWAGCLLLISMLFAGNVGAREVHQLGSLMISNGGKQAVVSWHRSSDEQVSLLTGSSFVEGGMALIDLFTTSDAKSNQAIWGQLELLMLENGGIRGTILDFNKGLEYQFESSETSNFLIEKNNDFLKVEGSGTGT